MIVPATSPFKCTSVIQNPLFRPFEDPEQKISSKPVESLPWDDAHLYWKPQSDQFQQYILPTQSSIITATSITGTSSSGGSTSVNSDTPICDLLVARGVLPNRPVRRVNQDWMQGKGTQDGQSDRRCSRNGIHRVIMQLRIDEVVRKMTEQSTEFPRPDEGCNLSYQDYKRISDWVPPPPTGAMLLNQDFGRNMA